MSFRVKVRLKSWKRNKTLDFLVEQARRYREQIDKQRSPPQDWERMWDRSVTPVSAKCPVCGMAFTDAMGRPIAMGYCCPNTRCPSAVTSYAVAT